MRPDQLFPLLAFLSAMFGLLAVFPYCIYPASLMVLPRRRLHIMARRPPSATLVFCAYNEESAIAEKIENLRAIRRLSPEVRFSCYVDASTDRTLELLRQHPDLLTVQTGAKRVGKAAGMTALVSFCDTDIVIFTDANVILDPQSIPRLLAYFSDPTVGGVCGMLHYTNAGTNAATKTSSAYWRLEERIKSLEARCGSTMGADGSIFATRRILYPYVPPNLLDDFIVSMTVVFQGYRLISVPDVRAYEAAAVKGSDEFRRRRRIACRAYLTHMFLRPRVLRMRLLNIYKYFGHKVVRWYSIWFALASLVMAVAAGFAVAGVRAGPPLMGLLTLMAGLLRHGKLRLLGIAREAVMQFLATGLGMTDAWRGISYRTWNTPATRAAVAPSVPAVAGLVTAETEHA